MKEPRYNKETKELTLEEDQINNVDRGLRNEKELREKVRKLLETIRKKDSIIESMAKDADMAFSRIAFLNEEIKKKNKSIERLSSYELEIEKKKKGYGLYAVASAAFGQDINIEEQRYNNYFMGLSYVKSNILFGFSFNPFNKGGVGYKVDVGFKFL